MELRGIGQSRSLLPLGFLCTTVNLQIGLSRVGGSGGRMCRNQVLYSRFLGAAASLGFLYIYHKPVLDISLPKSFLPLLQPLNLPPFLHQNQPSYCASLSPNELQHLQIENHDTLQPRTTYKNPIPFIPRLPSRI